MFNLKFYFFRACLELWYIPPVRRTVRMMWKLKNCLMHIKEIGFSWVHVYTPLTRLQDRYLKGHWSSKPLQTWTGYVCQTDDLGSIPSYQSYIWEHNKQRCWVHLIKLSLPWRNYYQITRKLIRYNKLNPRVLQRIELLPT